MSVHTHLTHEQIATLAEPYQLGKLTAFEGVKDGITNTIYKITLDNTPYILTIFEELTVQELPFFIELMDFLARRGLRCPRVFRDKNHQAIQTVLGKCAVICEYLPGKTLVKPNSLACQQIGEALAKLHQLTADFPLQQTNKYDLNWHQQLAEKLYPVLSTEQQALLRAELAWQAEQNYSQLPQGVCHMDLFVDNVLFDEGELTGLLDFYFACNNIYLLDLAVAMCAWSITNDGIKSMNAELVLVAYQNIRPLTREELPQLKNLQRYAALHFWMTRLRDKYLVAANESVVVKDPEQFLKLLQKL
jgi:homoserine kinase type II